MGFLSRLFKPAKKPENLYIGAGAALTYKLATSLNLEGWQTGEIPVFTQKEIAAMEKEIKDNQQTFNEQIRGEVSLHPEIVEEVRRAFCSVGLNRLADSSWRWLDDFPVDWKKSVSTYLKSWAYNPGNPAAMLNLGNLLIKAGYKGEAREAFQVVLFFPFFDLAPKSGLADTMTRFAGEALEKLESGAD